MSVFFSFHLHFLWYVCVCIFFNGYVIRFVSKFFFQNAMQCTFIGPCAGDSKYYARAQHDKYTFIQKKWSIYFFPIYFNSAVRMKRERDEIEYISILLEKHFWFRFSERKKRAYLTRKRNTRNNPKLPMRFVLLIHWIDVCPLNKYIVIFLIDSILRGKKNPWHEKKQHISHINYRS